MRFHLKMLASNQVMKNGIWLFTLQMFNTVVPLLTLPYITRVLGPSQYGAFSIALNWIGYFDVAVLYGFDLTGARKVALARDRSEISKIMSVITYCKLGLCALSFIIMVSVSLLFNVSDIQFKCMLILFMVVLGDAIKQTWLFQGMQIMHHITITSVIARIVSVILIFTVVKSSDQLYLYCGVYATTAFLVGMISLLVTKSVVQIDFCKASHRDMFEYLKDGWYLFTTAAMTRLFTGIGITVLGITASSADVGIYSAIQKVPYVLSLFYTPVGQALYPHTSQKYSISVSLGNNAVIRYSKHIVLYFGILGIAIICFGKPLVRCLYGFAYEDYSYLLLPLICWLIVGILNNLLGVQVLVASGHQKEYSKAFTTGTISIIVCNVVFGYLWGLDGIAYAAVISEVVLLAANILQIRKIEKDYIKGLSTFS